VFYNSWYAFSLNVSFKKNCGYSFVLLWQYTNKIKNFYFVFCFSSINEKQFPFDFCKASTKSGITILNATMLWSLSSTNFEFRIDKADVFFS
jgi:hypothetical protein